MLNKMISIAYMYLSIVSQRVDLGTAPMMLSFFSPSLKNNTVGMLRIPYLPATFGDSSVLSLKQLIFPAYSLAKSSIMGAIIRQGPHQGAQKSTIAGSSLPRTRLSHVVSVTTWTADYQSCRNLYQIYS